jgi:hypothetical protein
MDRVANLASFLRTYLIDAKKCKCGCPFVELLLFETTLPVYIIIIIIIYYLCIEVRL